MLSYAVSHACMTNASYTHMCVRICCTLFVSRSIGGVKEGINGLTIIFAFNI